MTHTTHADDDAIRVATFNVSMEGSNYSVQGAQGEGVLIDLLKEGTHPQIHNIAEIIQRTRPDIILLNEFDYIADTNQGAKTFIRQFLNRPHGDAQAIDYPYYFVAPVNTGVASPFDLDRDGIASGKGNDAWGFGHYPGQYGMLVLSRYPIDFSAVRTFQEFKWADLPDARPLVTESFTPYFTDTEWQALRLSSKSHWDIPVNVKGESIHLLASHPTPPVFDGPERRNALRNRDEVRFWSLYIDPTQSTALSDDKGIHGGLADDARFVILGDLNASPDEGDSIAGGIETLLEHPALQGGIIPRSEGGSEHSPLNPFASSHTAQWGMRADYVLPSLQGFEFLDAGVFWPPRGSDLARLVGNRNASSDHRLVWVDLRVLPLHD